MVDWLDKRIKRIEFRMRVLDWFAKIKDEPVVLYYGTPFATMSLKHRFYRLIGNTFLRDIHYRRSELFKEWIICKATRNNENLS